MKSIELSEVMKFENYVVLGNTTNETKYAFKIKHKLLESGYQTVGVGSELTSIDDVPFDIDVIDFCINPIRGLELIKNTTKSYKCAVLQPGAESLDIESFLETKNIPYLEGCLLVGCARYPKK